MKPTIDLTGRRFGRLLALRYSDKNDGRKAWVCRCDCGVEKEVRGSDLRKGKAISCGCYIAERLSSGLRGSTHGMTDTPTYYSWSSMLGRCNNPNDPSYPRYGGRGIGVCERWSAFESFLADMGERPEGKTLDRFPNKFGNYEPGNCRWATAKEQANNLERNFVTTFRGRRFTLRELSDETGVPYNRLRDRIYKRGWDAERALTAPMKIVVTEDLANQIRACLAAGEEQRPIAAKFGVSQGLVSKINRGAWRPSTRVDEYESVLRQQAA